MIFATLVLLIGIVLWRTYRGRRYANLFKSIPGPKGYPLVGNAMEFAFIPRNKRIETCFKYFNTYGRIFLLYIESVVVVHSASADWAQVLLTSNTEIKKGFFYKFLKPWLFTGLLTSDGEKWYQRRKMLTPAFHFSILNFVTSVIRQNSMVLLDKLEAEVNSEEFDVIPYLSSCSLDIICEAAMSVKIDSQRGLSKEYLNSVHLITEKMADRVNKLYLYSDIIHWFSKNYRDQNRSLNILHGTSIKSKSKYTMPLLEQLNRGKWPNMVYVPNVGYLDSEKVIERTLEETHSNYSIEHVIKQRIVERQNKKTDKNTDPHKEKKKAFIDLLLDISDQTPESLSVEDILEEVTTFMFEGHDTIATSLGWTLFLVGHHPEVQKNIFEEQYAIFGDSTRLPDQNDLAEMKYLEYVFKESLRLYPSVPLISRCLMNETKIGNYTIPAGVDIALHIYQIHRSPEHFKNPNLFDPSHFFPEEAQRRHPFAFIPFSAGPRNCVGQKFAMLELKIILSQIFRNFEVESLQKMEDKKSIPDMVLRPEFGVRIRIQKRKNLVT